MRLVAVACAILLCGLTARSQPADSSPRFASDLAFIRQHTTAIVLGDPSGAQVVVAPAYQGRVLTSTTGGDDAPSFGWIGRAAVESGKRAPHMNVFGGEDRFWLGPEGGQFALYFKRGDPFDFDHWQTPEPFDWGGWTIASRSPTVIRFHKPMALANYAGTKLSIDVDRTVRLLTSKEIAADLGTSPGNGVRAVAFESSNTVTNSGTAAWTRDTGLVSIWILGQFNPTPRTTIALPIVSGPESTRGPLVNDAYFGKVPADRLTVKGSVVLFRADGQYRSKIGLPPSRARSIAGSYDAAAHVLTLVQYSRPADATSYVNSMWEIQKEPFKGDVVNSYNDGPPAPGQPPLGPFYELETSSPALDLAPGAKHTHVHRTFHFVGPDAELDRLARATLTIGLADLAGTFPSK
jgi:hypothetical protein